MMMMMMMLMMMMMNLGVNPLVSTLSGHPQFSALWCPPIYVDTPRIFDHLVVNYICYCVLW